MSRCLAVYMYISCTMSCWNVLIIVGACRLSKEIRNHSANSIRAFWRMQIKWMSRIKRLDIVEWNEARSVYHRMRRSLSSLPAWLLTVLPAVGCHDNSRMSVVNQASVISLSVHLSPSFQAAAAEYTVKSWAFITYTQHIQLMYFCCVAQCDFRFDLLSRRSRQRERLSASVLSICSFVGLRLFVCLSVCCQNAKKRDFLKK